jgi:hypothetical protein
MNWVNSNPSSPNKSEVKERVSKNNKTKHIRKESKMKERKVSNAQKF